MYFLSASRFLDYLNCQGLHSDCNRIFLFKFHESDYSEQITGPPNSLVKQMR